MLARYHAIGLALLIVTGGATAVSVRADDRDGDGVPDSVDWCNNTPPGTAVDLQGRPLGDIDRDCDTDLADFALFGQGFTGLLDFTGAVPSGMVLIPGGDFEMGDTFSEYGGDELPVHTVALSSYCIDTREVTNQQYADALNWAWAQGGLIAVNETDGVVYKYNSGTSYPYYPTGHMYSQITLDGTTFGVVPGKESYPVVMVTWYGAAAYANWRGAMRGKPLCYDLSTWECNFGVAGYRLPTEAEWEMAARGGAAGHRFPWVDTNTIQHARANYYSDPLGPAYDTSPTRGYHPAFIDAEFPYTSPVGYFAPNGFGLYDMAGNVYEWVNDWWGNTYYSSSPYSNPHGPASGTLPYRVFRGGTWCSNPVTSRCAHRDKAPPEERRYYLGFRLVMKAE